MPSLVVIEPQIEEKHRGGTLAYILPKQPSLNRVKGYLVVQHQKIDQYFQLLNFRVLLTHIWEKWPKCLIFGLLQVSL